MTIDWGNATFSTGLTSQAQPDWIIQTQQQMQMQFQQGLQAQFPQTTGGGTLASSNYFYNCTFTQPITVSTNITNNIVITDCTWVNGASNIQIIPQQPAELTAEQAEQFRRQQAEWAKREEKAREELAAAELKAQALIEEILDADARKQLKANGYIDVPVTAGGLEIDPNGKVPVIHNREGRLLRFHGAFKFYRIRANAGVYLVDKDGKEKGYLCIHTSHPDGVLPPSDDILTKWFTAKHDEERLWTVGNFSHK